LDTRPVKPDFTNGQQLPFRLRANPVVTRTGKRFGLVGEESHREWLKKKSIDNGFTVNPESFNVIDEGLLRGEKWEDNTKFDLSFRTVFFEGHLQVTNTDIFLDKGIKSGIGPAKGFGCGLLSVPYKRA
jgi:CRISPR system Cascade subunit CasE